MTSKSREQLELFIQLAEKLKDASYTKQMEAQGGFNLSFKFNTGLDGTEPSSSVSHNFPQGESVVALVVRARQFIQAGDIVSVKKLAELLDDDGISKGWKDRFKDVQTNLTAYLKAPSMMKENEHQFTHREVFDIFASGDIAHHSVKEAATLKRWKSMGIAYLMLEREFHEVINMIVSGVAYLYNYTLLELRGEPVPPIPEEAKT